MASIGSEKLPPILVIRQLYTHMLHSIRKVLIKSDHTLETPSFLNIQVFATPMENIVVLE